MHILVPGIYSIEQSGFFDPEIDVSF